MDSELEARVGEWIAGDPDPEAKRELEELLQTRDEGALRACMTPLQFGTAGLRAPVGAGPGRMNRAVIIRTTAGLAAHLVAQTARATDAGESVRRVVVGYDARLTSRQFAEDTAAVFVAAGLETHLFRQYVPTPVLAYAARELEACAAVCVTASHNPAADNGYKVYGANAVQIVSPEDREIEAAIHGAPAACDVPMAPMKGGVPEGSLAVPQTLIDGYFDSVLRLSPRVATPEARLALRVVYTPVHGVGGAFTPRALAAAGFTDVHPVAEQIEPDGRFPTATSPNPEKPEVLRLATTLAQQVGANVVFANDPDADRLAICVSRPGGGYRALTGNAVGVLLADFLLQHAPAKPASLVVSSVPSTPMAESIAAAHDARFAKTLTGFKWIWNTALELEKDGTLEYRFGFEEALGYGVGRAVRDKDGISAAVVFAELVAAARARGKTVWDELGRLYAEHGVWASAQYSHLAERTEDLSSAVAASVANPPSQIGNYRVTAVRDYRTGIDGLPPADIVEFVLGSHGRVMLRPSGTEPKVKVYADFRTEFERHQDVLEQLDAASDVAAQLAEQAAACLQAPA
jgi:phosphomannomutase